MHQPRDSAPELVFGLIHALGTPRDQVQAALVSALRGVSYEPQVLRLSHLMHDLSGSLWSDLQDLRPLPRYIESHISAGNELCKRLDRGDAVAMLGVNAIAATRRRLLGQPDPPMRRAFILRSLKRPAEVDSLRRIYGPRFVLLAAYMSRSGRLAALQHEIREDRHINDTSIWGDAERLITTDAEQEGVQFGQSVSRAFPLADVFVDASDEDAMRDQVERFVRLFFGDNLTTPTREESGMFHAAAAALRSASLSRQVGAALATTAGAIVAVGANEVPRALGGQYWPGDNRDGRDFRVSRTRDTSDILLDEVLADTLDKLSGWLTPERQARPLHELSEEARELVRDGRMYDVTEYMRAVHAEMAALTDAALRGVPVNGLTLYCTTFPCHSCAKHLVAAGIRVVRFIEPYPKSLVADMYGDSISIEQPDASRVQFLPYVGVAPRRYPEWFLIDKQLRKRPDGRVVDWDSHRATARPRLGPFPGTDRAIQVTEDEALQSFNDRLRESLLLGTAGTGESSGT